MHPQFKKSLKQNPTCSSDFILDVYHQMQNKNKQKDEQKALATFEIFSV